MKNLGIDASKYQGTIRLGKSQGGRCEVRHAHREQVHGGMSATDD
jgi:hypothetical protein